LSALARQELHKKSVAGLRPTTDELVEVAGVEIGSGLLDFADYQRFRGTAKRAPAPSGREGQRIGQFRGTKSVQTGRRRRKSPVSICQRADYRKDDGGRSAKTGWWRSCNASIAIVSLPDCASGEADRARTVKSMLGGGIHVRSSLRFCPAGDLPLSEVAEKAARHHSQPARRPSRPSPGRLLRHFTGIRSHDAMSEPSKRSCRRHARGE